MTSQPSFREERDFAIAAHENQARLTASLKPSYDFHRLRCRRLGLGRRTAPGGKSRMSRSC